METAIGGKRKNISPTKATTDNATKIETDRDNEARGDKEKLPQCINEEGKPTNSKAEDNSHETTEDTEVIVPTDIDHSEGSYNGPWETVTNHKSEQDDETKTQRKTADKPKTSFDNEILRHSRPDNEKTIQTKTKKTLTNDEVSRKCDKTPKGLSKGILDSDQNAKLV